MPEIELILPAPAEAAVNRDNANGREFLFTPLFLLHFAFLAAATSHPSASLLLYMSIPRFW